MTFCFNGETGEIVDIGPASLTLRMEDAQGERLVDYEREDWPQLQLAYAHHQPPRPGLRVGQCGRGGQPESLHDAAAKSAVHRTHASQEAAVIVVSGGLENKQTGRIYKTALEVAVANDKIARRFSGLAERLAGVIA